MTAAPISPSLIADDETGLEAIDVFGAFTIPGLPVGPNRGLGHEILEIHGTLGQVMLYLIVLHVLGALERLFVEGNGELYLMLPFGRPKA